MSKFLVQDISGEYIIAQDDDIVNAAREIAKKRLCRGKTMGNPDDVKNFLCDMIGSQKNEIFGFIALDSQNKVIEYVELGEGTIDGCSVYPRTVVKKLLDLNAKSVILSHNHPSGTKSASQADVAITNKIKEACSLFDIRVLDHVIVCGVESYSFAEHGLI